MFNNYCAVCHGKDGKGGGPAASALKTPPADLTTLAQKNGGKYPSAHISSVIRGQASMPSHGSQDMPVWGPLFSSISQGHESDVQQTSGQPRRIHRDSAGEVRALLLSSSGRRTNTPGDAVEHLG